MSSLLTLGSTGGGRKRACALALIHVGCLCEQAPLRTMTAMATVTQTLSSHNTKLLTGAWAFSLSTVQDHY